VYVFSKNYEIKNKANTVKPFNIGLISIKKGEKEKKSWPIISFKILIKIGTFEI
jgi:hypothetical protein